MGLKTPQAISSAGRVRAKPAAGSGTQAIERAVLLVRVIASYNSEGLTALEIAAVANIERTTVHRILRCLVSEGLVMQDSETHRYFLGSLAFEVGISAASRFNVAHVCSPWVCRIAEQTGDTVFLMLRSGYDSVCIDRRDGAFPIKVFTRNVGARRPLGLGAGSIAMMMSLSDEEVNEIVLANRAQYKAVEGISVESVLKRLNQARRRGYALNEFRTSINTRTVSLRIVNRFGYPFAAITIGAIESRMSEARQKDLVSLLKSEIAQLERAMNQVGATGMQ